MNRRCQLNTQHGFRGSDTLSHSQKRQRRKSRTLAIWQYLTHEDQHRLKDLIKRDTSSHSWMLSLDTLNFFFDLQRMKHSNFQVFKEFVEIQIGHKLKRFWSDNGGEYINKPFCANHGIIMETTDSYSLAENRIGLLSNWIRPCWNMHRKCFLPKTYWRLYGMKQWLMPTISRTGHLPEH